MQKAAAQVHTDNAPDAPRKKRKGGQPAIPPPEFGPKCYDPETLTPKLLYQREQAYAMCMAVRMETWLAVYIAENGIPADSCARVLILLPIYVEAMLKARIVFPDCFPKTEVDEEDEPVEIAWDEDEAAAEGLSIHPAPAPRLLPAPTLPGCQGEDASGGPCERLRRYGDRFCPSCASKEKRRLKAMARGV